MRLKKEAPVEFIDTLIQESLHLFERKKNASELQGDERTGVLWDAVMACHSATHWLHFPPEEEQSLREFP
jgi:hypothetical protein